MRFVDSPEDIKLCLSCPYPECKNCLDGQERGLRNASAKLVRKVLDLAKERLTDSQIAELADTSANTVYYIRRQYGVPNYRERTYGRAAGV